MRFATLAVLSLVGLLSVAPSANADGWKGSLNQFLNSNPNSNNGNQFGQLNNNQNGNNGNHYGWDKNGNGQSVPGPDTLILLGAGLIGLVSWRNISRKA